MDQADANGLNAARDLIRANKLHEAAVLLVQIIDGHPDDEQAWHMLSFALSDPDQQAFALRRVLELNPGNRAARSQLARCSQSMASRPCPQAPAALPSPAAGAPAPRPRAATAVVPAAGRADSSTVLRLARYVSVKLVALFLTVAVGLFLAVILINYGGYIDKMFEARIEEALGGIAMGMDNVPPEEVPQMLEEARQSLREFYGLNEPFLLRSFRWFIHGLTLDLGESERISGARTGNDKSVRGLIMERLPPSLLLATAGNLMLFVTSLLLALFLSKKYGSFVDKLIVAFSPLSAAPNWVHGILLTVIFASLLRWLPFGSMYDEVPPSGPLGYVAVVGKHMILPVAAIFMATFFASVYAWRTVFVLHSREDYVEMAEAKGLPPSMLERRYILRPTLPYILTSFALVLITFWQGLLVLEVFFKWPGIGSLFVEAVQRADRPVLVGLIVMFAYLLAITVFILDFLYAVVDPRIRVGGRGLSRSAARRTRRTCRRRGLHLHLAPGEVLRSWALGLRAIPGDLVQAARQLGGLLKSSLREMIRYPSAILGLLIILALVAMSLYALVTIPADQAIEDWRGTRDDWYELPKYGQPTWVNLFRKNDLPATVLMDSETDPTLKTVEPVSDDMRRVTVSFFLDYPYGALPQEILIFIKTRYDEKRPHVTFTWLTPDGREIEFANFSVPSSAETYYLTRDSRLERKLKGQSALEAFFLPPDGESRLPVKGRYELRVDGFVFEEEADLEARLVLQGQVYGLAGTDNMRRDLLVPLLWGAPIALAFGFLGAVFTSVASMIVAGVGVWFGGRVDDLVQRLTEVNMILPALPIAIMVYEAYSKSIWVILAVMVLLSILGSGVKNYRAIFLQVKESPYVEAAQVYGASNRRIILRYLVPRIMPVLVPQLVTSIPGYVFLEATLAYLGVVDPLLPTWGKVVYDSLKGGALMGYYYWVLEPIALLMLTGLAFALLGFALDRIFNPRLRSL